MIRSHQYSFYTALLTFLLLCSCQSAVPEIPTPQPVAGAAELSLSVDTEITPQRNTAIEFSIDGVPPVTNPFDKEEIDIEVILSAPSGENVVVGGFWHEPFVADSEQPTGEGEWRARFTPTIYGEWRGTARISPMGQPSNEVVFEVVEGSQPGFIQIDPNESRYFALADGTRFLPIGINMGWWNENPVEDYTLWLDHFAANGGNTIRIWMANWAFAMEWNDTGLGDYRERMRQAWLLDEVLRLANERGIKVILVLNHHGQFSQSVNPQWHENPYNAVNGGPLARPEEFVSNREAIALFQRRMRYIVDRWASAPNLFAWEWWNEYNFTPIDDNAMQPWLEEMSSFLHAHDPYAHLATISGPAGPESPIWQLPGIDFVSVHIYSTNDPLHFASELSAEYRASVPNKPLLLAEFGFATGEEGTDSPEKTGIHLHNGLWASLMSGHAGSGMYWWWDTYVEPLGLWPNFAAIDSFFEGVDPAQFVPSGVIVSKSEEKSPAALGLLLKGETESLLWVRSNQYTAQAATEAYDAAVRNALRNKETLDDFEYTPPLLAGYEVTIEGLVAGSYNVQWFDAHSGDPMATIQVDAEDSDLSFPLPSISKDIAAKIMRTE